MPARQKTSPTPATLPEVSPLDLPVALLGGISPQTFMRRYWQKKPLLIRGAAPEYVDRFPVDDLFELASDEDVECRLVTQTRGRWQMTRGPLEEGHRGTLGRKNWSLLVQGVNLYDDDAADLLNRFRFIPDARLDDLMISYATDGGGVGPHFDSYDVFLLQTHGRRRWRISQQKDLSLDERQPMKILRDFQAEEEWILEPGDMLYLPPHVAHEGVALGECITCSIGFRAPSEAELTAQFLHRMAERIESDADVSARYEDRLQDATPFPAALPVRLIDKTRQLLNRLKWSENDVTSFLGEYLSEPKAHVFFFPPSPALRLPTFIKRGMARGLRLELGTQILYDANAIYINGDAVDLGQYDGREALFRLADDRGVSAADFVTLSNDSSIVSLMYEWYLAGWIHCE